MSDSSRIRVSLSSRDLRAEIDPLGAQLFVLQDRAGRDLLWDGDPAVWSGRAPILFPIVGVLVDGAYRLGSKTFHLSRHGFARGKLFSLEKCTSSTAVFRLIADDSTRVMYPFSFDLSVQFELDGSTLGITTSVRNSGEEEMPASVGYHPALRWPLPFGQKRASHFIQFEMDEPAPARRIDTAGLLTPLRHPTPIVNRQLLLTDEMFKGDVLIFDQIRSRSVTYGGEEGPRIRVDFADAPYLGIWTKPGAAFICIEPWHGITDIEGFSGDFTRKAGVFVVSSGAVFSTTMHITLVGG